MTDIILGAGILGLTCAHHLAYAGRKVRVIEAHAAISANQCSWFAGGMIAPWCELAAVPPDQKQAVLAMGARALSHWQKYIQSFEKKGTLVVAHPRDHQELHHFAAKSQAYQTCDAAAIAALEPDLAGRFQQGLFFAEEAHLDPRACLTDLYQQAARAGVGFEFGQKWTDPQIAEASRQADNHVIDCRGLASRQMIAEAKQETLRGVRGEMMILHAPEVQLSRPVRFLHPRIPLYIVPRGNHRYMIGATMIEEENQAKQQMSVRSGLELLSAAYALHPGFGEAHITEMSVGWRPAFSDNHPRMIWEKETAASRQYYLGLNGAYRHGFLAAPSLAAECLALLTAQEAA